MMKVQVKHHGAYRGVVVTAVISCKTETFNFSQSFNLLRTYDQRKVGGQAAARRY